jgi:hypothetical protein
MYTVAIYFNAEANEYAITCRDLDRSLHWVHANCDRVGPWGLLTGEYIYDMRVAPEEGLPKLFTVLFKGDERRAKACKTNVEMMFAALGVNKITIKPVATLGQFELDSFFHQ